MKDISVEYAHIYTNKEIGKEQKFSLDILSKIKDDFKGKSVDLVVLVDDYSFPDPSFDYDSFTEWLSNNGHRPDIVLRESQLIPACDQVLKVVTDKKLKEDITSYIKSKKYPCSLFISAWFLLRLGYIKTLYLEKSISLREFSTFYPKTLNLLKRKPMKLLEVRLIRMQYLR